MTERAERLAEFLRQQGWDLNDHNVKQCHACGTDMMSRDRYCSRCGTRSKPDADTLTELEAGIAFALGDAPGA